MELEGQQAIVTGGASGIGRAVVELFARQGARVAVFDRDGDGARAVAAAAGGHAFEVDVRDGEALAGAVDAAAAAMGGVSVLVNNAGVGDLRPLHTVDEKLFRRLIDVNFTGTYHGMRAVIPRMLDAGGGAVVNVASLSGLSPTRNEAPYSAAKAAVIALTRSGALEYGPTVRVNCVAPGFVRTALTAIWDDHPDAFAPIRDAIPLHRIGDAGEIAELVLFLCSDAFELRHRPDDRHRRWPVAAAGRHRRGVAEIVRRAFFVTPLVLVRVLPCPSARVAHQNESGGREDERAGRRLGVHGVEGVQQVATGDRARHDRQVVAEVERAVVLQRDVRDVRAGQEAARVRRHQFVVSRRDVRVGDAGRGRAGFDRVHVRRPDEELVARVAPPAGRARRRPGTVTRTRRTNAPSPCNVVPCFTPEIPTYRRTFAAPPRYSR